MTLHPSPNRPHHLRREGRADCTYVRVGSSNRKFDLRMPQDLSRYFRDEVVRSAQVQYVARWPSPTTNASARCR